MTLSPVIFLIDFRTIGTRKYVDVFRYCSTPNDSAIRVIFSLSVFVVDDLQQVFFVGT